MLATPRSCQQILSSRKPHERLEGFLMLTRLASWLLSCCCHFRECWLKHDGINWQPWSDSVFAQAKREGRFVLLDLGTVWCHWCHVMEEVTYQDPAVIELVNKRYIAVRVDADGRPDLSNRYEDYGWPATIVFNGDGGEIVKRRGYLPPAPDGFDAASYH